MENILNANDSESDDTSTTSFDRSEIKTDQVTKADLFGDEDDDDDDDEDDEDDRPNRDIETGNNSSSNPDETMDEQDYNDVAQEIEDNLAKAIAIEKRLEDDEMMGEEEEDDDEEEDDEDIRDSRRSGEMGGREPESRIVTFDDNSNSNSMDSDKKRSLSFEQDIIFPNMMDKYVEERIERNKRKEMKSKKEIEEEEREKMQ